MFVDTNVAIELRDDAASACSRLTRITPQPVFSLITWIAFADLPGLKLIAW